ncbi:MAG: alpha/beta hydrolase [Sphaerochaetaceae bacterium]|jgi:putative tributyrin esterase
MPVFRTSFVSYVLRRSVDVNIMVPGLTPDEISRGVRTHRPKAKYPVLYLLHGYWGNQDSWLNYSSVARYAEEYSMVIVTMAGENNSYIDLGEFETRISEKLFPVDYYDFIETELPQFVRSYFPVSSRMDDTYIAGLSMGGYGALIHGLAHPNKFRAVGAFSPVTTLRQGRLGEYESFSPTMKAKYEPVEIIRRRETLPALYYSYGDLDYLLPLQDWFEGELNRLGVVHTCSRRSGFRHEWRLWDQELDRFLAWLPRSDVYKDVAKRQV